MSPQFKLAYKLAAQDVADEGKSFNYYIRLHIKSIRYELEVARTGMARGFEIIEPKRLWA